ncbi:hypothetical protein ACVIJ1_003886 [Bradyrhizobium elkanii]
MRGFYVAFALSMLVVSTSQVSGMEAGAASSVSSAPLRTSALKSSFPISARDALPEPAMELDDSRGNR